VGDEYRKFFYAQLLLLISIVFGLLWAFPVMWCWNYVVTHISNLPRLSWRQAWCLYMLCNWLVKSSLIVHKNG
jgi:hypothetical protein